jgi:hypothetical protein
MTITLISHKLPSSWNYILSDWGCAIVSFMMTLRIFISYLKKKSNIFDKEANKWFTCIVEWIFLVIYVWSSCCRLSETARLFFSRIGVVTRWEVVLGSSSVWADIRYFTVTEVSQNSRRTTRGHGRAPGRQLWPHRNYSMRNTGLEWICLLCLLGSSLFSLTVTLMLLQPWKCYCSICCVHHERSHWLSKRRYFFILFICLFRISELNLTILTYTILIECIVYSC